jgi:8-oxo-dGTP diphosphatase
MPNTVPDKEEDEWLHVVAAVIEKNNQVLIAQRPKEKHQGGLWEFPGGKVELGESAFTALKRELKEEVNLEIQSAQALLKIRHRYPDKAVLLDIYRVRDFRGEAQGLEGQPVKWVKKQILDEYDFPEANQKIISALKVPEVISITSEAITEKIELSLLAEKLDGLSGLGCEAVYFRVPQLGDDQYIKLFNKFAEVVEKSALSLKIIVNRHHFFNADEPSQILNLSSKDLKRLNKRPANCSQLSASVHNEEEIKKAEELDCDFVLLSPVLQTKSHPDAQALTWEGAQNLIEKTTLPVVLLGGLKPDDLSIVKSVGGFGVAGISHFGLEGSY